MARRLINKPNTETPSSAFPYGRIKDNPGDNTGTPVNEEVYGDIHQFFERMMAVANRAFNNQPDSITDGFQFFDALRDVIRQTAATTAQSGTAEIATQSEVNAKTDNTRIVTALTLANAEDIITDNHLIEPRVKMAAGSPQLITKIVDIGDWNMDADSGKSVNLGVNIDTNRVHFIDVTIRDDTGFVGSTASFLSDGEWAIAAGNTSNLLLTRDSGSKFDSSNYNSTSFNRGWLKITYAES